MFRTFKSALNCLIVALGLFAIVSSTAGGSPFLTFCCTARVWPSRFILSCQICLALPEEHSCSAYVDYLIPGEYFSASGEDYISTTFQTYDNFVAPLLCNSCVQNVNASLCRALLPRCESANVVRSYCDSSLETDLSACGSDIAGKLATFIRTAASSVPVGDGSLECFNVTNTLNTTECSYAETNCGAPEGLGVCGQYVDWFTFKYLPGLEPSRFASLAEFILPTFNYPNCSECTFAVRKLMCAGFFSSCYEETARSTASQFVDLLLAGGALSSETALNSTVRVCYSQCQQVLFNCSTHIESLRNFFFSCDARLPGLPPSFELYPRSSASCVNLTQISVSPTTCPVFLPPAPAAPMAAPLLAPISNETAPINAPAAPPSANVSAPVVSDTPRVPPTTTRSEASTLTLSTVFYAMTLLLCLALDSIVLSF